MNLLIPKRVCVFLGINHPDTFSSLFVIACCWSGLAVADDSPTPPSMVFVPGGSFDMGDPFGEGTSDELPVHTVHLSPYYIDQYEVTNEQYAAALNWAYAQGGLITVTSGVVHKHGSENILYCDTFSADSESRIQWDGSTFTAMAGKVDHPMLEVSWYGSAAYSNWRSAMEGKLPCYDVSTWTCDFSTAGYRLPTEAEWENAAGWDPDQQRHFRFGEHTDGCGYNCLDGQRANNWSSGDPNETGAFPWPTPVGYYDGTDHGGYQTQNAQSYYGCYDMSGNAWEWCHDRYSSTYYSSSPKSNPTGVATGSSFVLRGGGWNKFSNEGRTANRAGHSPGGRENYMGFRCALGADGSTPTCAGVNDCSGNGTCIALDTCECESGWEGVDCSTFNCTGVNNCSANGTCIGANTCDCNQGFGGSTCLVVIPAVSEWGLVTMSILVLTAGTVLLGRRRAFSG